MAKPTLSSKPPWKIDSSIDVDRISPEDVKFIFTQAEKRLGDTVKTGEDIASKTMSIITLFAGVLIALSGYIISSWKDMHSATHKDYVALFGCLYIVGLFIYMIKNVLHNKHFVLGSKPQELMIPQFFAPTVMQNKITLFIYISEIENYNFRIEENLQINSRLWSRYRLSMYLFLLFPIALGTLYSLLEWVG